MPGNLQLPKESLPFLIKIFGPLAEGGEYVSDQIRYFRWKSSVKMMNKAKIFAEENGLKNQEVPFKILVPLIEKSSLEDEDSPLIDVWAKLLATASHDPEAVESVFVNLLSQLTYSEVQLIDNLADEEYLGEVSELISSFRDENPVSYDKNRNSAISGAATVLNSATRSAMAQNFQSALIKRENLDDGQSYSDFVEEFLQEHCYEQKFGVIVEALNHTPVGKWKNGVYAANPLCITDGISIAMLLSLGLMNRFEQTYPVASHGLSISTLSLSPLGLKFVASCRGMNLLEGCSQ